MRVVFMGTPAFAVPSLAVLHERHDVRLVVTRPDRPSGRRGAFHVSAVKEWALAHDLPVSQPSTLRGELVETIKELSPDVVCVAAFGMLLPDEMLDVPKHGCVNVHASLLPRYRGAAPIQRAILEGEHETGVSIMRIEKGLDTGPYALQRRVPIGSAYAPELEAELARVGAEALSEVLDRMMQGEIAWVPQRESDATYAPKVTKDDVALRPELTIEEAHRRVRASSEHAPSRASVCDRELTVIRATPVESAIGPGRVSMMGPAPVIGFADGGLRLDVVRPAGRRDMTGAEWARGARPGSEASWRSTR